MVMTIKKIVQELCKREGLKKQVNIAQVSELVGHLSDMLYDNLIDDKGFISPVIKSLILNGQKRAEKKKKAKKK